MTNHAADRAKLDAELASLRREFRVISLCVWSVAAGVMIYGLGNVYGLLVDHEVPKEIAWILSPMVDAGLCIGLVATRGLTRHGIAAGWIGSLRWVTALMTWTLNIAAPLTKTGGIDWLGVFIHSVGPILLFVVVEGAAYYQHKMGLVISAKESALTESDEKQRADRAERAEMVERLRRLESEKTAALTELESTRKTLTDVAAENDSNALSTQREMEALRVQAEALRAAADRFRTEHSEALSNLTDKHTEELARMRAEMKTVKLADYRETHDRRPAPKRATASPRATLSDEDAVQKLLAENDDPSFEWSQAEIRRVTGVGFSRTPRILTALAEYHRNARSETPHRKAVGDLSDDAEERPTVALGA